MKKFLLVLSLAILSVVGYSQGQTKMYDFISTKQKVKVEIPKKDTTENHVFTITTSVTGEDKYISFTSEGQTKAYKVEGLLEWAQNEDTIEYVIAITNVKDEADKVDLGLCSKGEEVIWIGITGPNKTITFYIDPKKK